MVTQTVVIPSLGLAHGRHWELTSYEWDPRTGQARFGYTHRYTGRLASRIQMQSKYYMTDAQRRAL